MQRDGDDDAATRDDCAESSCHLDGAAPCQSGQPASMSPHVNAESLRAWLTSLGLQQHTEALDQVTILLRVTHL